MTIAKKYLKDSMKFKDFIRDYIVYCKKHKEDSTNLESLSSFFKTEVKPLLTSAERTILENIDSKNFKAVGRKNDYLYLRYTYTYDSESTDIKTLTFWYMFHNLFKFIEERRRIFNRRSFERRMRMIIWDGMDLICIVLLAICLAVLGLAWFLHIIFNKVDKIFERRIK